MLFNNVKKKQKGYSLPQMLTATAVGAVLTGVATTNYWSAVDKSRITAEFETIDRISEAVNVVLASDAGATTYLTDSHRKLLQELIPDTGGDVTYAIRSTWKGEDDNNGNHQYALSLDLYPRHTGSNGTENARIKDTGFNKRVNNVDYVLAEDFVAWDSVSPSLSGDDPDSNATYAVAVEGVKDGLKNNAYVVLKNLNGNLSVVDDYTVVESDFNSLLLVDYDTSAFSPKPNGMQKIALLGIALDSQIDGGDGGSDGKVHYDDTCNIQGADKCYIHIYLVDRGLSYNESLESGMNEWHDQRFITQFKSEAPKSVITSVGQVQSTVILGRNGDG
ncbi:MULTISPECIES: Tfp pilus assembly protein FimT/FimU [unclassified Vibrio]|uniref:pilus assembly FimT family protein n=1 Tax=unclassified Vibrio TaxID=2614977 RepID=UPI000C866F13|nr:MULTISPECIES: hypothetical protein [unclassified Vibrio]PMI89737.1 hypothetical protein BCU34_22955 [Vibrio sp. 10N.286.45.E10]PTQ23656.1 hypothetical protein CWO24_12300 [Vibrio sp. 10N.286.46.E10]